MTALSSVLRRGVSGSRVLGWLSAAAFVAALAGPAQAADPYNFDFTGPSSSTTSTTRTFKSNGAQVTASAYSTAYNLPNSTLARAYLGHYSGGLGVGIAGSTDDLHTVDNSRGVDVVVFEFSFPVRVTSLSLTAFGDTDFDVWTGNLTSGYNFTGLTIAQLNTLSGLTNIGPSTGSSADRTAILTTNIFGNYLVVAARAGQTDDSFKIARLTATPGPVAGAGLPVILGILGVGIYRRRRSARPARG